MTSRGLSYASPQACICRPAGSHMPAGMNTHKKKCNFLLVGLTKNGKLHLGNQLM